jgi:hypothetical protein
MHVVLVFISHSMHVVLVFYINVIKYYIIMILKQKKYNMSLISCFNSSLVYLNSTIRYTIHDTIQNITILDTKYDSISMLTSIK